MTDDDSERSGRAAGIRTARMEAFSDGVFAIAITLLVLDLAVPADAGDHLLHDLAHEWPTYLAYVVSFATIGAVWLAHSVITEYLERADATLLRLNLLLLLVVSFIPFPTRVIAEYVHQDGPERVATTLYGLTLLLASALVSVLWRYSVRAGLIRADAADVEVQTITRRLTPGLVGYVVMLVLGLVIPVVAVFGYLAIAIFLMIPIRSIHRSRRSS